MEYKAKYNKIKAYQLDRPCVFFTGTKANIKANPGDWVLKNNTTNTFICTLTNEQFEALYSPNYTIQAESGVIKMPR